MERRSIIYTPKKPNPSMKASRLLDLRVYPPFWAYQNYVQITTPFPTSCRVRNKLPLHQNLVDKYIPYRDDHPFAGISWTRSFLGGRNDCSRSKLGGIVYIEVGVNKEAAVERYRPFTNIHKDEHQRGLISSVEAAQITENLASLAMMPEDGRCAISSVQIWNVS